MANTLLCEYKVHQLALVNAINKEIEKILADPKAKTPLLGQSGHLVSFLPRQYADFMVAGDSYSAKTVMTTFGTAEILVLENERYYVVRNATITDTASVLCQNPLVVREIASASIDLNSGVAVVSTEKDLVYLSDIRQKAYLSMLDEINLELAKEGVGMYATKLYGEKLSETEETIYPADWKIPVVNNEHVLATLTGAAFADNAYGTLVAFGMVAHKVTIESILATVRQGKKKLGFSEGFSGQAAFPSREVKIVTTPMPKINMWNTFAIAREATPGGFKFKDEKAYVISFKKDQSESLPEIIEKVTAKLIECLAFPIRPEWGPAIYDAAVNAGFLKTLVCFGEIRAGRAISLDRNWQELLEGLLKSKKIRI